jgi:hypothetical protein
MLNVSNLQVWLLLFRVKVKVKQSRYRSWSGPEDGDKIFSLTQRPPYPQEIHLVLIYVRG